MEKSSTYSGITYEKFIKYYVNKEFGYAYEIENFEKYKKEQILEYMNIIKIKLIFKKE